MPFIYLLIPLFVVCCAILFSPWHRIYVGQYFTNVYPMASYIVTCIFNDFCNDKIKITFFLYLRQLIYNPSKFNIYCFSVLINKVGRRTLWCIWESHRHYTELIRRITVQSRTCSICRKARNTMDSLESTRLFGCCRKPDSPIIYTRTNVDEDN